eukprot:s564_g3.t11
MREAIPLLEADEDVQRYAWFSYFKDEWAHPIVDGENGDAGLVHPNGTLTPLGQLYNTFAAGTNLTEINITEPQNETSSTTARNYWSHTLTTSATTISDRIDYWELKPHVIHCHNQHFYDHNHKKLVGNLHNRQLYIHRDVADIYPNHKCDNHNSQCIQNKYCNKKFNERSNHNCFRNEYNGKLDPECYSKYFILDPYYIQVSDFYNSSIRNCGDFKHNRRQQVATSMGDKDAESTVAIGSSHLPSLASTHLNALGRRSPLLS